MEIILIIIGVLLLLVIILAAASIKFVGQAQAFVIKRLGGYHRTLEKGPHIIIPFIDGIELRVPLKEQVVDFPPQPVITKDNVTMQIDTVVYFQITDPKLYCYGVSNPLSAIENLTATTLRNIIGELELDESLTSRDVINTRMRSILDEATDPWGIKVNRVELKNIIPPRDIQDAMEQQMRAERQRRSSILKADGEKESAIRIAEGQKRKSILEAEAAKEAKILAAEADKEAQIRRAEGEAEAILTVQEATAEGLRKLNAAEPKDRIIALKSLEAFAKVGDGKATKIIIPSDLQNMGGLITTVKELLNAEIEEEK